MLLIFFPIVADISVKNFRVHFTGFFYVSDIFLPPSSLILTICIVSVH